MFEGPKVTCKGDHSIRKISPRNMSVGIGDGVEGLYSVGGVSGWTASDIEAEERRAILSYRSKRLEEASAYFQRKLIMEEEDFPVRSLRNVTGPLKEIMLTLFQGPNEVHALQYLEECGVHNEVTKMDLLSILNSKHLTRRDFCYIFAHFVRMREPRRPNIETTVLPSHGSSPSASSPSGSSPDKRSDERCSARRNKRRRGSSGENYVERGSSDKISGRRGAYRGSSGRCVSFGKSPIWGGPPVVINSSGKHSINRPSVEDLGSGRSCGKQFASVEDFGKFDVTDCVDYNEGSFDKTVRGSMNLNSSIGHGDRKNITSSGRKLPNLEKVHPKKKYSNGTPKEKGKQKICRRSGKSRLPGLSNILELGDSPVLRIPDQNVIIMYAEVKLSNQNDCSRINQLLIPFGESMAGRVEDPPASSIEQPTPAPSREIITGRLEDPPASSTEEPAPAPSGEIITGRLEDPPASSIEEAAPASYGEIITGRLEDPPAPSIEEAATASSGEIITGRLEDPPASSIEEAATASTGEITGRLEDPPASSIDEAAPASSGEIITDRLEDPPASSDVQAAPTPSGEIVTGRLEDPLTSSVEVSSPSPSNEITRGKLADPLASSDAEAVQTPSVEIITGRFDDSLASGVEEAPSTFSSDIMTRRRNDPLNASDVEAAQTRSVKVMTDGLDDPQPPTNSGDNMAGRLDDPQPPTPSGDNMAGRLDDFQNASYVEAVSARLPEHGLPDGSCHWKDLPADTFQCPIRFCEAVEENIRNRVSNSLEEIEKLHIDMPVTTLEMLWQLTYFRAELQDIRDSRVDIDNILENFDKLSQLQNVAVKRLLDFLKVFDEKLMNALHKATTDTEDQLPPLFR